MEEEDEEEAGEREISACGHDRVIQLITFLTMGAKAMSEVLKSQSPKVVLQFGQKMKSPMKNKNK